MGITRGSFVLAAFGTADYESTSSMGSSGVGIRPRAWVEVD